MIHILAVLFIPMMTMSLNASDPIKYRDTVDGWYIMGVSHEYEDICSMAYSVDDERYLILRQKQDRKGIELMVGSPTVKHTRFRSDKAEYYINKKKYKSIGKSVRDGNDIMFHIAQNSDEIVVLPNGEFRFKAEQNDVVIFDANISKTKEVDNSVNQCFEQLADYRAKKMAPILASPNRTPEPRTFPGSWIRPSDYPKSSLHQRNSGKVDYILDIDSDGNPTQCTIRVSSGDLALDDITCKRLMENAKFYPATDAEGKPIAGKYEKAVKWSTR